MSTNIADRLRAQAEVQPTSKAVMCPLGRDGDGRRTYTEISFRELNALCDRYARGFSALGVKRGMRCLVFVTPCIEFFALTFALYRLGAVTVMIDPAMGKEAVLQAIREAEPEAFIAVPKAQLLKMLFRQAFRSVKINVTVGRRLFWGGRTITDVEALGGGGGKGGGEGQGEVGFQSAPTEGGDTAAILFTSGSTGAPKGVIYTHRIFDTQVDVFARELNIGPSEVDLSAFPLFSLFSLALGAAVVVPDMDVSHPARVEPEKIVEAVTDHGVTYVFGSPAFWEKIADYCGGRGVRLESLKRVLMAGAPAPVSLLERLSRIVSASADIFTPYGATESLPVSLPSAHDVLSGPAQRTQQGAGTWVGRPIQDVAVKIIRIVDGPIARMEDAEVLPAGEIGEIVVKSPVTTTAYFRRDRDNALSKIRGGEARFETHGETPNAPSNEASNEASNNACDEALDGASGGEIWHRMGDVGYLDTEGCLWFCGRKSHRVQTDHGVMYTVPCEAIFNRHPAVFRSALVGIGPVGKKKPVVCIECRPDFRPRSRRERDELAGALLDMGRRSPLTERIEEVLFVDAFPVDARHNAKIRREVLAITAERALLGRRRIA
ncbi:MAG: AMP-binding protein [Deltaproteobacteria bacterium]|nr:AMP-binding protein [Deltaproteobacteria bacterium]